MDGGAWLAAVHGVAKSRTRLSNFTFTFHFHVLEKEMATHSSILARVRHDWSDLAAAAAAAAAGFQETRLKKKFFWSKKKNIDKINR